MSINPMQFPFYCQKVIPLVYDESLSYYELLCKITAKLNDIIEEMNKFNDKELNNNLKYYIDEQDSVTLSTAENYTNQKTNKLECILYNQIQILTKLITASNETTKEWLILQLDIFKNEIANIPLPAILNPITGKIESVQKTFNSFYDYLRCEAISAQEFDNLQLTAKQFDNKELTAREFDLYSKTLLVSNVLLVRSPFNGELETVSALIHQLAALHQNGITASNFDNLEWTAETYDNKQITAYNFDWSSVA